MKPHFVALEVYDRAGRLVVSNESDVIEATGLDVDTIAASAAKASAQRNPTAAYVAVAITPYSAQRADRGAVTYKKLIILG